MEISRDMAEKLLIYLNKKAEIAETVGEASFYLNIIKELEQKLSQSLYIRHNPIKA